MFYDEAALGECVQAYERFYLVTVAGDDINTQGWSENEKSVIACARWWTIMALSETVETIYPANIVSLLALKYI